MDMIRLPAPPPNAAKYTRSQTYGLRERTKADLKLYLEQYAPKIVVLCSFGLINELGPVIAKYAYAVSFVPIEDSPNFAEFYLERAAFQRGNGL